MMDLDTASKQFCALWAGSQQQERGVLHDGTGKLQLSEARSRLQENPYVDYYRGKVFKVDFSKQPLRLDLYDRDMGQGAGEAALKAAGLEIIRS